MGQIKNLVPVTKLTFVNNQFKTSNLLVLNQSIFLINEVPEIDK